MPLAEGGTEVVPSLHFSAGTLYMAQLLSWASLLAALVSLHTLNKAEMKTARLQTAPASTHRKDCTVLFRDGTKLPSFRLFNEDTRVPGIHQPYSVTQSQADPSFLRLYHS